MSDYLPQNTGEFSLWGDSAGPKIETEAFSGAHAADVLVVGAGYTGLSAALHLAEQGVSVVLLEAGGFGFGGSGRNAGLVNAGVWQNPEHVGQQLGKSVGEKFTLALRDSPEQVFGLIDRYGIDCDAERKGTINVAHSTKGFDSLRERCRQLQERGSQVELIDGNQSEQLSGSSFYSHGGILDRNAGTIQPLSFVRGLARSAIDKGARLYQQTALEHLHHDGKCWQGKTARGHVTADKVILATNAYSDDACLGVKKSTIPVFIYHFATDPLDAELTQSITPQKHGLWDTQLLLTSTRIDRDGRLVMCSAGTLQGFQKSMRQRWLENMRDRIFPQLKGVKWAYHWTGQVGVTSNKLLRIQELSPGLYAPAGYNGRGIGPGVVIGQSLADLLVSGDRGAFPFPIQSLQREHWRGLLSAYYSYGTLALNVLGSR